MLNWRKGIISGLFFLTKNNVPKYLTDICALDNSGYETILKHQMNDLKILLLHSYLNVPYYKTIFEKINLVDKDLQIRMENFFQIPVLTKEIVKKNFEDLKSKDLNQRKWHFNTSGGSTGEPIKLIQDEDFWQWGVANKIYYKTFVNHNIGERELRLWGSERDLLQGKESFTKNLKNWLYNRKELNCFLLTEEKMMKYSQIWNSFKPSYVESYVQSIYEFAKFVKVRNLKLHKPKVILASAGTLYQEMKLFIEDVFQCPVINRYGSREVHDVACSCLLNKGLHVSTWSHYIEILDSQMNPVRPGQAGKIYVTALKNFSMPLIRYDIGDIGVKAENEFCSCGRSSPLIKFVEGREMSVVKGRNGTIIPAEFFIHFIGVVYNTNIISKFQVIQNDFEDISIKVIVRDKEGFMLKKIEIENSIKLVMGQQCIIRWEFVNEIASTASGKYLYVISKIK